LRARQGEDEQKSPETRFGVTFATFEKRTVAARVAGIP
jgi:hypothetical protein